MKIWLGRVIIYACWFQTNVIGPQFIITRGICHEMVARNMESAVDIPAAYTLFGPDVHYGPAAEGRKDPSITK